MVEAIEAATRDQTEKKVSGRRAVSSRRLAPVDLSAAPTAENRGKFASAAGGIAAVLVVMLGFLIFGGKPEDDPVPVGFDTTPPAPTPETIAKLEGEAEFAAKVAKALDGYELTAKQHIERTRAMGKVQ